MKILDEYVIILNILLLILLLYNLFQKCKTIEGHPNHPSAAETVNNEKAKSSNAEGDSLINEVNKLNDTSSKAVEDAKTSNKVDFTEHNKKAKENEKAINEALNS